MAAYVFASVEVTDPERFRAYAESVGRTVAAHGGRYLAVGGRCEVLEGGWEPHRVVLLEFPSRDAALEWYGSADYSPLKDLRVETSRAEIVVLDGLS
jgi:uncharacterized protein (DUF1330 family)